MSILDLDKLKDQGRRFATGFTPGQKVVSVLGVVGVLLALFMFTKWENKAQYAPLFTNLDSKSAGEVTQALDSKGIKYQLTDGGATVLVPKDSVYKTRADLSTQGVPKAETDGWSIMDQGGITRSDFLSHVDYQRALQTELSKTIEAIDGIDSATVNLTVPQQSIFVDSTDSQATAAVLVTPTTNAVLPAGKVQAIVNLVSSSIPDLSPDKVTVADSLGNVLSSADGTSALASQQVDATSGFDQRTEASIQSLIAASLGTGHSAVNYNAVLNFDKTNKTIDQFSNGGKKGASIPSSVNNSNETFTGGNPNSQGVLGTNTAPNSTANSTQTYKKNTTQTQNAVNQVHSEIQSAPGSITRASVAVLLDSSKVKPADVAMWKQTIAAAAGLDPTRGDVISVNLTAFDKTAAKAQAAEQASAQSAKSQDFLVNLVRSVVLLLIVAAVLFLAWRAVKKSAALTAPVRVPLDLRELEAGELLGNRLEAAYERTHAIPEGKRPALEVTKSPLQDDLDELIKNQPDEVALTLRSWLADRRS